MNTDKLAFPQHFSKAGDDVQGMTLRDYFAAKAMQGMCANPEADASKGVDMWVKAAYEVADAMLKAREQ